MRAHVKKCRSIYFRSVLNKEKPFELRKDDCDYQVGDRLILSEIDDAETETGELVSTSITYKLSGPVYGLADGWCILGLRIG